MDVTLEVNGFPFVATYDDEALEQVFKPLVERWAKLWRAKNTSCADDAGNAGNAEYADDAGNAGTAEYADDTASRVVVLMAAPPGTGKTTLSLMLEKLAQEMGSGDVPKVQAIGMDGFHYLNEYLETHTTCINGQEISLRSIKGAPDSFDVASLAAALKDLHAPAPRPWPVYSRVLHNPVPEACSITGDIVLVEGNYLLLDAPVWRDLSTLADDTLFLTAAPELLKTRLIERKIHGGLTRSEAEAWYEAVDGKNVETVLNQSVPAHIQIELDDTGYHCSCEII